MMCCLAGAVGYARHGRFPSHDVTSSAPNLALSDLVKFSTWNCRARKLCVSDRMQADSANTVCELRLNCEIF